MEFLKKLDILMKDRDIKSKKELSNKCGIPYTTIMNWYSREFENMSVSNFKKVCSYFGVTMDSMAYDDKEIEYISDIKKQNRLSMEERKLLSNFGDLNEVGKGRLLERSESLIEDGYTKNIRKKGTKMA